MESPENDPTAVEPDEIAEPSPEVEQTLPREEQTPPAEYEPQSDLEEGQDEGIVERESDLVADIEEVEDSADPAEGVAADDDLDDDPDDN